MELEKALVDSLKTKYGPHLEMLDNGQVGLVVRPPKSHEWDAFLAMSMQEDKRHLALKDLGRACICHPDRDAVGKILEQFPALTLEAANVASEMARGENEVVRKKL